MSLKKCTFAAQNEIIMKKQNEAVSSAEMCPVRDVVARFSNKWGFLVLLVIDKQKVVRFGELTRLIPDISTRVLSTTLRTLEADELIQRKMYPEIPPRVEYSLTPLGEELVPMITCLTDWASKNLPTIIQHREQYEHLNG